LANTVVAEIADLETRIALLDEQIKETQHLIEIEEGGGGGRFRSEFRSMWDRRDILNTRLQALLRSQI